MYLVELNIINFLENVHKVINLTSKFTVVAFHQFSLVLFLSFISIYLVTYINRNFVDDAACVFMCKKKKNTGREEGNSGERG